MAKKQRTPTIIAATVANKIIAWRNECSREIATAPESIKKRYQAKEAKLLDELDPEVSRYVAGLLDAHYDEVSDEDEPRGKGGR
jgi:hypothetical protein